MSTGSLPQLDMVQALLDAARRRYANVDEGTLADYIPALARTPWNLFGLCIVGVSGDTSSAGDARHEFSIQSVSKPFVFALACEALGADAVRGKIGVNNSGLPFDSIMTVELNPERTMNAMVNAGAIATTSLAPGEDAGAKWRFIREGLSRFASRELELDEEVFASEAAVNQRNRGLAYLLESDNVAFVPNDRLREALSQTPASSEDVSAAVRINTHARLLALKITFFAFAGFALLAYFPAGALPRYAPKELPRAAPELAPRASAASSPA